MKSSLALLALAALGAPTTAALHSTRDQPPGPIAPPANGTPPHTDVLNYALALTSIQSAFYTQALAAFDAPAFAQAGLPPAARARYVQIAAQEQAHAALLNASLGGSAVQACNYTFPLPNVTSFVNFSQILEGVATSAYLGVLPNVTNTTTLLSVGAILSAEAQHSSWIAALRNSSSWDGPYATPLTPRKVLTLAAPYTAACPNPAPAFAPFPPLNISAGAPGSTVTFSFSPAPPASNSTSSAAGPVPTASQTPAASSTTGAPTDSSAPPIDPAPSTLDFASASPARRQATDTGTGAGTAAATTTIPSSDAFTVPTASATGAPPSTSSPPLFAAFLSGLQTTFAPIGANGSVLLPQSLAGLVYALVTRVNGSAADADVVAGPAVLVFESGAQGNVTGGV